ncbi:MAG: hypothetical protein FWH27_08870, partial [Planctomycetaceae bacterium]|nr:hypothetical protein [Planctomycetaceae bacterium]
MTNDLNSLIQHHPRDFGEQQYVYPVVSRRSRGVSIGINLSLTALCNFHCVYCQVVGKKQLAVKADGQSPTVKVGDRSPSGHIGDSRICDNEIDLARLEAELRRTLTLALNGEL